MAELKSSWNRIVAWLQANAPDVLKQHQKGATSKDLAEIENQLAIKLPDDVKQFYTIVNGADPDKECTGIFPSVDDFDEMAYAPMPLSQVQREWSMQRELLDGGDFDDCEPEEVDQGIRNEAWNLGWIPFAGNGGGDLYCIDMAPGEGGNVGQIISHSHETFTHLRLADSLAAYLEDLAEYFEDGKLEISDDYGVIIPE